MRTLFAPLGLLLSFLLTATGPAAARDQSERLLFDVMFGGLHIADVIVVLDQNTATYTAGMQMKTRGVIDWFDDFTANIETKGAFQGDAGLLQPVPATYRRGWASPEVAAEMTMVFDPTDRIGRGADRIFDPRTGLDLKAEDLPWNNRQRPIPVIPDDKKAGAIDPISAFVGARRLILETGQREVRMPIYDGRRRYDVITTVGTPRMRTVRDIERSVIPVRSRMEPVYGFEPDGEDRMRESEGEMYFTADDRFVPVQIILGNSMFASAMNLIAECNVDPAPCEIIAPVTKAEDEDQRLLP